MKCRFSKGVVAAMAGVFVACVNAQQAPESPSPHTAVMAQTQQGKLSGSMQEGGSAVFEAIPFAAPPTGVLRWKAPQAPAAYAGVRDATHSSSACMQMDQHWNTNDAKVSSEDCLYLNLATPAMKPVHPLPVIFWIHGGGNTGGSGRAFVHSTLIRHGVVLVTINYRLGVFGFLAHPALTAESPNHASGNYAVQDQIAALKWVKANIANFGGDANNITIAGQSAGAGAVGTLLLSPEAKGLFQHAIAESGGPIIGSAPVRVLAQAEGSGVALGASAGIPAGPAQLAAMRTMPAEQMMQATAVFAKPGPDGMPSREGPNLIVDGYVLPKQPAELVRAGEINRVPVLIGTNVAEFPFGPMGPPGAPPAPEPRGAVVGAIHQMYGAEGDQAVAAYGMSGDGPAPVDPLYGSVGTQLMADSVFRCPALITDGWLAGHGDAVYAYQFERPLPGMGGASTQHSGELPYVFGWAQSTNSASPGLFSVQFTPEDAKLSMQIQDYWTSFAKTGRPEGAGLPAWPKFAVAKPEIMRFTVSGPKVDAAPREQVCRLYKQHIEEQLAAK